MLPGPRTASIPLPDSAEPLGWRLANALAIAAPYILAAVLFAVLYLQPAAPAARAAVSDPAAASGGPATAAEPLGAPAPAAAPAVPAASRRAVAGSAATPAAGTAAIAPAAIAPATTAPGANGPATAPGVAPVPPAAAKEPPLPRQPVPVDTVIASTMRLSDPLAYPAAARGAHVQGVVVLTAVIGADGAVQSVEPVSGPALLEVAALNAVRTWRYRPYLVYGRRVAFTTQVVIDFKLDEPVQ